MISNELWFLEPIQNAIGAPSEEFPEQLREAAVAFDEAIKSVNRRLREASRLLRVGLRSEAIQLAEADPALLELVGELDSVLEDWQGMLAQWEMDLPPDLELEIAAELNVAYAELQPLEDLLRKQRVLALARAPLGPRITVLRQIVQLDDFSESWKEDLQALESQRLRQIGNELRNATRAQDKEKLESLRDELKFGAWAVAPPIELLAESDRACIQQQRRSARDSLAAIVDELNQAYMAFDLTQASGAAKRWREQRALADLPDDDPVVQDSLPALDWVASEEEAIQKQQVFDALLRKLERALDSHAPREELETLVNKAERFELPMPELLVRRVRERMETQRQITRRKGLAVSIASALFACALVIAVGVYWWSAGEAERIAAQVKQLHELESQKEWRQIIARADRLQQAVLQRPDVASLMLKAEAKVREEEDRAIEVEQMLAEAEQLGPDHIPIELMNALREEVRSTSEKRRLASIDARIRQFRAAQQRQIDKVFTDVVATWAKRVEAIEQSKDLSNVDFYGLMAELDAELGQHSQVSSSLRGSEEPLRNKLRALHLERETHADLKEAQKLLAASASSPARFKSNLSAIAGNFKDEVAGVHAAQLLSQQQNWLTIAEWASFWQKCRPVWGRMNSDLAASILKKGSSLRKSRMDCQLATQFDACRPYLEHVAARDGIDLVELKSSITRDKLINGVWLVWHSKGSLFYCPSEPVKENAMLNFSYWSGIDEVSQRKLPLDSVRWGLSPQSRCGEALANVFANHSAQEWDALFLELVEDIRNATDAGDTSEPSLDPILAMKMLSQVLVAGGEGSYLLDVTFSPMIDELMSSGVDLTAYWHLPEDPDARVARDDARMVVRGLADCKKRYAEVAARENANCVPPAQITQLVGVALLDRTDAWRCSPQLRSSVAGTICVARGVSSREVSLSVVGSADGGSVAWDKGAADDMLLSGQPLFLVAPPSVQ